MIKTVVDKNTGKVLYCRIDEPTEDNEVAVEKLLTEPMENPYFDFTTRTFYDKII